MPHLSCAMQLVDNRNCVLCMECLKACPHRCAWLLTGAGCVPDARTDAHDPEAQSLARSAAPGPPTRPDAALHSASLSFPSRATSRCTPARLFVPRRSIEVRLRLPGVDLWTTHKPLVAEVWLMFMLLGAGGGSGLQGGPSAAGRLPAQQWIVAWEATPVTLSSSSCAQLGADLQRASGQGTMPG